MTVRDDAFWRYKAEALLIPSPFRDLEARRGDPLFRAAADAHDANVPVRTAPPGTTALEPRHPLSAKPTGETFSRGEIEEREGQLEERRGWSDDVKDAAAWYRERWWDAMSGPAYPASHTLPDHAIQAHRSLAAALAGARHGGDTPAMLYLHVGPVQSFIEAARRTHDLWIGSYTVAYLTYLAAEAIALQEGPDVVVYPNLHGLALARRLLFEQADVDRLDLVRSSLANRVLAVVPRSRAADLARAGCEAAASGWKQMGDATLTRLAQAKRALRAYGSDFWRGFEEQIADHLEVDAVVQPWPETRAELRSLLAAFDLPAPWWLEGEDAEEDRDRIGPAYGPLFDLTHRVLTAHRKGVAPAPVRGDHRPKCTQCGAREQMGPIVADEAAGSQQRVSREFFADLSVALQSGGAEDEPGRPSLQITRGEALCAVCLTKRLAPEVYFGALPARLGLSWNRGPGDRREGDDRRLLRFPSVPTIATAPLRFYLQRDLSGDGEMRRWLDALDALHGRDCLDFTPPGNLLPGLARAAGDGPLLAHEGQWFYDSAYEPMTARRNHEVTRPMDADGENRLRRQLATARAAFGNLCRKREMRASTYYAVIVLDGDRMGQWLVGEHEKTPRLHELGELGDHPGAGERRPVVPALHGELSRRLAALADHLHGLVDAHFGRVVYSGGDDLLALLPLQTALPCLQEIERSIRSEVFLGDRVTISAGVAIAHVRTPLSRALEQARGAEKWSKRGGRDRFTLWLDKRSGAPLHLPSLPWRVDGLEVLDEVLNMLRRPSNAPPGGDPRPLAGLGVAYELEQEVAALGAMRDAFLLRVESRLSGKASRPAQIQLLRALPCSPRELVDVLLLLRFLMREEHGIDTNELLRDALYPKGS